MVIFFKGIGKMAKLLEKVFYIIKKINQFMKETGRIIYNMEKVLKLGNPELNIPVTLLKDRKLVKVNLAQKEIFMKEIL